MINTYDSYVKESGAITIEQMRKMHENMMLEIGEDEDALELYDDLCNAIFPMRIFVQSGIHSQQKRKWIKILSGQPVMITLFFILT